MYFFLCFVRCVSITGCCVCNLPCFCLHWSKAFMGNGKKELPIFMYIHGLYLLYQNNRYAVNGRSFKSNGCRNTHVYAKTYAHLIYRLDLL